MTIRELYEWAKARNAEDMTLHVDTWHELRSALVVEDELAIVKVFGIKRVVIQK